MGNRAFPRPGRRHFKDRKQWGEKSELTRRRGKNNRQDCHIAQQCRNFQKTLKITLASHPIGRMQHNPARQASSQHPLQYTNISDPRTKLPCTLRQPGKRSLRTVEATERSEQKSVIPDVIFPRQCQYNKLLRTQRC